LGHTLALHQTQQLGRVESTAGQQHDGSAENERRECEEHGRSVHQWWRRHVDRSGSLFVQFARDTRDFVDGFGHGQTHRRVAGEGQ